MCFSVSADAQGQSMGVSRLDVFYRRLLLTKLFIGGWGKPEDLKRIFEFRKIVGDREKCKTLVPVDYPVYITKTEELADCRIHDGFFISPLEQLVPGILPPEAVKASLNLTISNPNLTISNPNLTISNPNIAVSNPNIAISSPNLTISNPNLAISNPNITIFNPTLTISNPNLTISNPNIAVSNPNIAISSPNLTIFNPNLTISNPNITIFSPNLTIFNANLTISNPNLTTSNPNLTTSNPNLTISNPNLAISNPNITIFSPNLTIFNPNLTISNPNLTTSNPNLTISNPNLISSGNVSVGSSCSFGLSVYLWLQGVLSRAVNWAELEKQYAINSVYEREIFKLLEYCGVDSYKMGTEVQRRLDSLGDLLDLPGGLQVSAGRRFNVDMQCATSGTTEKQGSGTNTPPRPPSAPSVGRGRNMNSANCCRPSLQTESISFMKGVMDECTHMANFSVPVDTSLIIVIQAREDAYIPRTGVLSLQEIWPGCEVRYLNGGHISAYLFKQNFFRKSIYDAFDRFCLKYPSSP
ncbi:PREDICTED: uncharacterized protein C4orf29 homolog [Cyprinodon variegatus]|uniref:uncharacterized protein C4orf29 homolog n=1 Tax=Cyprinodon variegatus TaxID=28743 RepID=UPI00074277B6|nr:PREDICTED: uncharacterized protein C4orf29 homolog [Cyprinodon variegatus]